LSQSQLGHSRLSQEQEVENQSAHEEIRAATKSPMESGRLWSGRLAGSHHCLTADIQMAFLRRMVDAYNSHTMDVLHFPEKQMQNWLHSHVHAKAAISCVRHVQDCEALREAF
jgi:hypothetical protein